MQRKIDGITIRGCHEPFFNSIDPGCAKTRASGDWPAVILFP
jgi:hypothetical protein